MWLMIKKTKGLTDQVLIRLDASRKPIPFAYQCKASGQTGCQLTVRCPCYWHEFSCVLYLVDLFPVLSGELVWS